MILVTGATGGVGVPLVSELATLGLRVRASARGAPTVTDRVWDPAQVDVHSGNIRDADGWPALLKGCRAVFVNARALGLGVASFLRAAGEMGVTRVVVLASDNVDDDLDRQPSRHRGDFNKEAETAAIESSLAWVSLRPSMFHSNALGLIAPQLRIDGAVRGPYPRANFATIAESDIARAAAVALTTASFDGQKLYLTGPRAMTSPDQVAEIAALTGRSLKYEEVTPDVARTQLGALGFNRGFIDAYLEMLAAAVDRSARTTNEIENVTGHAPVSFSGWAAERAGAWG